MERGYEGDDMVAGRRAAVEVGCEEVGEERARVGGDAVVLCLWLNVEPVRLRGDHSMRCAASVHSRIVICT